MTPHRLKERLRAGETLFGVCLGIPSPPLAEIAGWAGFDFIFADTEHGPAGAESATDMVRAAEAGGAEALVRVTLAERTRILRALDAGATGVLVPQVNSKEEAERVAAAACYPPDGVRGIALSVRAARYGLAKPAEYLAAAKTETLVCVQVETRAALENAGEIASVPGIDVLFVGPTDLSMNLGHPAQLAHPEVEAAIERIFEAALSAEKVPGILANDVPTAEKWMAKGSRLLAANGVGAFSKAMAGLATGFQSLKKG
ncbi:MAG: HpcH/HpaI aldolase/citrate lyase family protein [Nitrospinota bacterium]